MSTVEEELARADALTRAPIDDGRAYDWGNDRVPTAPPLAQPRRHLAPQGGGTAPATSPFLEGRARQTWRWSAVLGVTGVVVGGAAAAAFARHMGYDWRLVTEIGVLVGVAAGGLGAAIPPAARALGWAAIAGAFGAVGAVALWLLMRVAPAFVQRITSGL